MNTSTRAQSSSSEPSSSKSQCCAHNHKVRFYDQDSDLTDSIIEFIGPGIASGESVLVIVTAEHRRQIENELAVIGPWFASQASAEARFVMLDAEQTMKDVLTNGQLDRFHFRNKVVPLITDLLKKGNGELRIYGEIVALLVADGKPDVAIDLENEWNNLGVLYPFSLLCAYPIHLFGKEEDAAAFAKVCDTHSHVLPVEKNLHRVARVDLLRKVAELDQKAQMLKLEVPRRKDAERLLLERERQLAEFVENALECMHSVGPDGTILWANKAELALLGFTEEEYVGQPIRRFHADQNVITDILTTLLRGESIHDYPARLVCKNGSIKHVIIHSNALFQDGQLVATRCCTRDVTDRVRLEQSLRVSHEELAEFAFVSNHDLQEPLRKVALYTKLLLEECDGQLPQEAAQYASFVRSGVDRMQHLLKDLLSYSRTIHHTDEQDSQSTDLNRALQQARRELALQAGEVGAVITSDSLPCVHGDEQQLSLVFQHLLSNALTYRMNDTRPEIHVSAKQADEQWIIGIRDNGIGFSPIYSERIFGLFKRLHKDEYPGTGLGLAICRRIVERYQGRIWATSQGEGTGATFYFSLPETPAFSRPETQAAACAG